MSDETMIIKKLDELIDLVKKNGVNKVENHTHHHYPQHVQWTYPQYPWNTTGGTSEPQTWPGTTYSYTSGEDLADFNIPTVPPGNPNA